MYRGGGGGDGEGPSVMVEFVANKARERVGKTVF